MPDYWVAKRYPWELYGTAENPMRNWAGPKDNKVEFISWVEPCPEIEGGTPNSCPGYYMSHFGPQGKWSEAKSCPIHGARWRKDERSPQEIVEATKKRVVKSGIPSAFRDFTFQTYPDREAAHYKALVEWAGTRASTESVLLMGDLGTGKTGLAIGALRFRVESFDEHGMFLVVPTMFSEIRSMMDKPGQSSDLIQQAMRMPGLLVLDDLGTERASTWVQEHLYNLINTRAIHNRPTIITTNLDIEELREQIGARTADRLKQYKSIVVDGPNLRHKKI